jgi:hypothetical protein
MVDKFIGYVTKIPAFHETRSKKYIEATEAADKLVLWIEVSFHVW